MESDHQAPEDDKSEYEREDEATTERDEADHSAEAVIAREGEKDRAEYVHPEGARDYRVEGNDIRDYVGVDPEYMTYANATEAPMLTDTERYDQTTQYDHLEGNYAEELQHSKDGVAGDLLDREYTDEDEDGKDDVTGLSREDFYKERLKAQEYRDNPNPETETQDSEPGTAGAVDPAVSPESRVDPEVSPSGFNPLA